MFNSDTLEVGIGMVFMFLMMSLICTGIKEWIEGILKWRAMDLEQALRTLLNDPSGDLTAMLYEHPLISCLFIGGYDPRNLKKSSKFLTQMMLQVDASYMPLSKRRNLPSYIPAEQFAKALIDIVGRGPVTSSVDAASESPLTVEQIKERAIALAWPTLDRTFLTGIDYAQGNLNALTTNLSQWFNAAMDRTSGWYKRRTQAVLFVIGMLVAGILNVDALYVMSRLLTDKSFRQTVVTAAASVQPPKEQQPAQAVPPQPAAGAGAASGPLHSNNDQDSSQSGKAGLGVALQAYDQLETIGLPIGWRKDGGTWTPLQRCNPDPINENCREPVYPLIHVITGWFITAFAIMLGAPFWFDVLNRFMVVRSTVKPAEKSGEEASKESHNPKQPPSNSATPSPTPPPSPGSGSAGGGAPGSPNFVPHAWKVGFTNQNEVN